MKNQYLYILLLVALTSCDSLEQFVEIDLPEHRPQLVLNAKVDAGNSWNVFLTKSRPIKEKDQFFNYQGSGNPLEDDVVTDATISVKVNGSEYATLQHLQSGIYGSDILPPEPGSAIEMVINSPGFAELTVSDVIPSPPSITEAAVLIENSSGDGNQSRFKFSFKDFSGPEKDYYLLSAKLLVGDREGTEGLTFTLKNASRFVPNLDELESDGYFYNSLVFGDDFIDGETIEVEMDVDTYQQGSVVEIRLEKVSEAFFKYQSTIDLQNDVDGNPFAEPVPIYSNVVGGLGVMSSSASEVLFSGEVNVIDVSQLLGNYATQDGFVVTNDAGEGGYSSTALTTLGLRSDNSFELAIQEPEGVLGSSIDLTITGSWSLDRNMIVLATQSADISSPQSFRLEGVDGQFYLINNFFTLADGRYLNLALLEQ